MTNLIHKKGREQN